MRVEMKRMGGEMVPIWNGSLEDLLQGCGHMESWQSDCYSHSKPRGQTLGCLLQSFRESANYSSARPAYLSYIKEQCLPTAIPEPRRRFREWQQFRRTRQVTMRVHIRRCRLHINRFELPMRSVDNGSRHWIDLGESSQCNAC